MYYIIVCLCLAGCVLAAPASPDVPLEQQQPTVIPIVSQSDELEPNGTYKFSYETGNGIKREETSYDKVVPKMRGAKVDSNEGGESDDSDEIHVQVGSYSYTAPDGTVISVRYIADENGFQPIGDHIPRVPAVTSGSEEKSGRALKVADNSQASSIPVLTARSAIAETPSAPSFQHGSEKQEVKLAKATSSASTSETSINSYDLASTTEVVKTSDQPSTTEATLADASTPESTSGEVSSTTVATQAEASTTETAKLAETPETPAEVSTTGADKEILSTSTVESSSLEASSTEAGKIRTTMA